MEVQNIFEKEIYVKGNRIKVDQVFDVENTQEIKNLVRCKYLKVICNADNKN